METILYVGIYICMHIDIYISMCEGHQTERQTDGWTDRLTDRQIDREIKKSSKGKCPGKSLQNKNFSKNIIRFILCWPSTVGHETYPWVWSVYQMRLHWGKKSDFSFASDYQLELALGLGNVACVYFAFQCWDHIWLRHMQTLWMLSVYVNSWC